MLLSHQAEHAKRMHRFIGMPRTKTRRIAIGVLGALSLPFVLFPLFIDILTNRPLPPSYAMRCGPQYFLWVIVCAATAGLACLTNAFTLAYSNWGRARNHPLYWTTFVYIGFTGSFALVLLAPFVSLSRLSCWVLGAIYTHAAFAAIVMAARTIYDTPALKRVPHFDISEVLRAEQEAIAKIKAQQTSPEQKADQLEQRIGMLISDLQQYIAVVETPGKDGAE